jgi:hypothetical protein
MAWEGVQDRCRTDEITCVFFDPYNFGASSNERAALEFRKTNQLATPEKLIISFANRLDTHITGQ